MKKLSLMDIKEALKDIRFRESLPESLKDGLLKYLQNPGCGPCNVPFLKQIVKEAAPQLRAYFPDMEVLQEHEEARQAQNNWQVINCSIHDLEKKLRELPMGRKQIAVSRFQDQCTVIVNELDHNF